MARTQKNKATMSHLCLLKARLAKLKRELIEGAVASTGGGKKEGFSVRKTGNATVGLIGFPSVGKSTLLTKLTGHYSESADYEFTTLTTVPGIVHYKGARIQLLDLPGIIEGARDGKGRGLQVISVAKSVDLILIVLSVLKELEEKKVIERELEGFGIRLNKQPPKVTIQRKERGGITFTPLVPQSTLDAELVKLTLGEYKIHNADVRLGCDATIDDLVDVIEGNCAYIPAIYVLNKIDQISIEELDILYQIPRCVPISAKDEWNFDTLLRKIWKTLDLIRVYTKPRRMIPDYTEPVVLKRSQATVEALCLKLHKAILQDFKYALVWGSSAKHIPQKVGKDHVLFDEDIIQIVKK
ncbi:developmentally-regulated GTP-binding protein 1-like isoform X2 [Schistocerca gregaria]|nr:developmentally-regulated GTP-binding protein 1-like isoform X2 [Schistocerca gregaria]